MAKKGASISGFPEWLPQERVVEQRVIDTLRRVFELHGFLGIETRAVETGASLLKKGDLTSSSVEYNGNTATRIDGAFSKDLRGSVVLMKVRDKTLRFSTDADTFKPDFEAILKTVKFVQ